MYAYNKTVYATLCKTHTHTQFSGHRRTKWTMATTPLVTEPMANPLYRFSQSCLALPRVQQPSASTCLVEPVGMGKICNSDNPKLVVRTKIWILGSHKFVPSAKIWILEVKNLCPAQKIEFWKSKIYAQHKNLNSGSQEFVPSTKIWILEIKNLFPAQKSKVSSSPPKPWIIETKSTKNQKMKRHQVWLEFR